MNEITYPLPTVNEAAIEVCEWIYNSIPYFTGSAITYVRWD